MNDDIASINESWVSGDDASPAVMVAFEMLRHSPFLRKCGQLHQWWSESGDVCLDRVQAAAAKEYWSGGERRELLAVANLLTLELWGLSLEATEAAANGFRAAGESLASDASSIRTLRGRTEPVARQAAVSAVRNGE